MESLRLYNCNKLTTASLFNIAASCSNLKKFIASGTTFTSAGFAAIRKVNPLAQVDWESHIDYDELMTMPTNGFNG